MDNDRRHRLKLLALAVAFEAGLGLLAWGLGLLLGRPVLEHFRWDARDAITLKVPGVSRGWAQWRTKESTALDTRFVGKKGQFNLAQLEGVGLSPAIAHRNDGDVLRLLFQQPEQVPAARLKELLADHLRGFREAFGKPQREAAG